MSAENLPPIHDTARLWQGGEEETLHACNRYRRTQAAGWSLSFLRDAAPRVFAGELTETALWRAVRAHVPEEGRDSVWKGLKLLLNFVQRHQWRGVEIRPRDVPVGHGFTVRITPIGVFSSNLMKGKWLLAIQPRLDDVPTLEQFRIWHSALHYQFCCDPLDPLDALIVDLSRNEVSGQRRLRRLSAEQLPILEKKELDDRFDLVASCFKRSIELVPELSIRRRRERDTGQGELF
jgi:hypothetical protein